MTAARVTSAAIAALKDALGPDGWLESAADVAPYLSDFRLERKPSITVSTNLRYTWSRYQRWAKNSLSGGILSTKPT